MSYSWPELFSVYLDLWQIAIRVAHSYVDWTATLKFQMHGHVRCNWFTVFFAILARVVPDWLVAAFALEWFHIPLTSTDMGEVSRL